MRWRGGKWSPLWWGFWQSGGKRHEVSICPWRGVPPPKGAGKGAKGDADFEQSRGEAEEKFAAMTSQERSKADRAALVEKIHALRYGGKVKRVCIDELRERWDELPHKADMTKGWRDLVHCVLKRFATFMGEKFPNVKECGELTAEHFKGFLESVEKMGVSARAWNYHLTILRGTLEKVSDVQGEGFREYLAKLPKRAENTVHRRPFTGDELEAVFSAAAAVDPELHPVIVAAACTALRRGDVAKLKWDAVDLAGGFATVKTTKTGETVEIPIFPPFRKVLDDAAKSRRKGNPYVFPAVARAYRKPSALDRRLRKVLAAAGFVTSANEGAGEYPATSSAGEAMSKVNAGMVAGRWSEARRKKGLAILKRHLSGETGRAIAAGMGIARGSVSAYLHEMENVGRVALVSPPKADAPRKETLAEIGDEKRMHRGSLCGWHSFRTTFCSLALANGVPMELLVRITGHRTAEIVEKHYNQSKREQARRAFGAAMPKAIAGAVEGAGEADFVMVGFPPDREEGAKRLAEASEEDWKRALAALGRGKRRKKG